MKNIFKKFDYNEVPVFFRTIINSFLDIHFFGYPYKGLKIIGITGTKGKSTTVNLLYKITNVLGHKAGVISTVGNFAGDRKILNEDYSSSGSGTLIGRLIYCSITVTTPEVWELRKLLSVMKREGCEYVFIETSSHALKEHRVARLQFEGAIFTNFSQDHLEYHPDMEDYFLTKRKMFEMLPKEAFALTNADDERGFEILEGSSARRFSYGFYKSLNDSHFHGKILKSSINGLELELGGKKVESKLIGKFNAYNLLAVWSACKLLGFDMERVKEVLKNIQPPVGRLDRIMSPDGVLVIVDYAHNPKSLEEVLSTINEIKTEGGRVISVFGCGGDRDPSKRSKMGRIAVALSDIAIFTSDNPRSEDPNKIIADMRAELFPLDMKKVKSITDRLEAIKEAVKLAKGGDIILCAGKGHEDYQIVKGVKKHFSDQEEFKKIFSQ